MHPMDTKIRSMGAALFGVMAVAVCTPTRATTAPHAISQPVPIYRTIKDFVVACDNTRQCETLGLRDGGELALILRRNPGANGAMSLHMVGGPGLNPDALRVDSKPSSIANLPWRNHSDAQSGDLALSDPAAIARFLHAVENAHEVERAGGKDAPAISLAGLRASLRLIDAAQGRLGSTTAWEAGGERANAVPAAAAPPLLPSAPAAPRPLDDVDAKTLARSVRKQQAAVLRRAQCGDQGTGEPDSAFALTDGEALVLLTCNSGAYQSSALIFRVAREGHVAARRMILPKLPFTAANEGKAFDELTAPDYDVKTGILSQMNKGRGVGDCGITTGWRFDGKDFHLAWYRMLDRCGGVLPEDWPTLWRTDVEPAF